MLLTILALPWNFIELNNDFTTCVYEDGHTTFDDLQMDVVRIQHPLVADVTNF
jgi:hypothetical protein